MFYKLEVFTYEWCPVIGNLDTETPYKVKEFFFTTLAEAEAEIGKQIKSGERYLYFLWFFRITCLPLGLVGLLDKIRPEEVEGVIGLDGGVAGDAGWGYGFFILHRPLLNGRLGGFWRLCWRRGIMVITGM